MATLEIADECLAPEPEVFMTYSGPDPWGVVKHISEEIKPFFHVSTSSTSNDRLNWDIAGDPITFYSSWWVKKSMSGRSDAKFFMRVQGAVSKTDNTGQFTLRMWGRLDTEVSGPAVILKPFWLTYSYLFYNRLRMGYISDCRNYIYHFRNLLKEHYNLGATRLPGKDTSFG
ncbi:MAG: hypothetical protein HY520_01760 [Candidatus Aenigmarchaeota archaeon]|nr:hypothetical protein [Candidatus Aenigmarchaeota archaeon]